MINLIKENDYYKFVNQNYHNNDDEFYDVQPWDLDVAYKKADEYTIEIQCTPEEEKFKKVVQLLNGWKSKNIEINDLTITTNFKTDYKTAIDRIEEIYNEDVLYVALFDEISHKLIKSLGKQERLIEKYGMCGAPGFLDFWILSNNKRMLYKYRKMIDKIRDLDEGEAFLKIVNDIENNGDTFIDSESYTMLISKNKYIVYIWEFEKGNFYKVETINI